MGDNEGYHPLHVAAMFRSPICAKLLVSAGADVSARLAGNGEEDSAATPLMLACANGSNAVGHLLLKHGASPAEVVEGAVDLEDLYVAGALERAAGYSEQQQS